MTAPEPPSMRSEQASVESTAIGPQTLVPGVTPISVADRLAWRAAAPLTAKKPQLPPDHGLFDLAARNQLSLSTSFRRRTPGG